MLINSFTIYNILKLLTYIMAQTMLFAKRINQIRHIFIIAYTLIMTLSTVGSTFMTNAKSKFRWYYTIEIDYFCVSVLIGSWCGKDLDSYIQLLCLGSTPSLSPISSLWSINQNNSNHFSITLSINHTFSNHSAIYYNF